MSSLRALMPALTNKHYFNYGGQGPLPTPSLEAITTSWERIQELGPFTNSVWPYLAKETNSTREVLAKLCGVTSNRLALTENVTSGCVLPLWGLPFTSGDRLLISDCEHPGVVAACKELADRKGLLIDVLPIRQFRQGTNNQSDKDTEILGTLEQSLRPKTRLVVLSHLLWNTGQLMPISEIAESLSNHPHKPYLLVDAAQSFGQLPVEEAASASDIFAFTGHKWACGPEGLGGVAISERVLNEANPTLIGWRSLKHEKITSQSISESFHQDSRRFEVATSCIPLLAGLRCSLELLKNEAPPEKRISKIRTLSSELWEHLQQINGVQPLLVGPPPSGLVSFAVNINKSPKEIVKLLGDQNFWIRDLENPLCLRACLHVTSKRDEINALCYTIKKLIGKNKSNH